jgi:PKD repeat protein
MLVNSSYTFNCLPLTPQHFKIISTIYYTINLNTIGDGTILINKNEPYVHGESVNLEAVPSNNFVFSKWSGNLSTNTNPITITMNSNKSINAHFVKKSSGGESGGGGGVLPPENIPPIADASAGEPYEGFIGEEILFDGSLSYDQDTDIIISWYWEFGDGFAEDGEVVNHTYFNVGNYTVNLTVTDNEGAVDTDTVYVVINKKLNNAPSKPLLEGTTSGNKNVSYSYYVSVSDEDNDPIKYFISWGDNTNITTDFLINNDVLYNHTWTKPGKYIMWVQAFDDKEAASEKTHLTILIDVTPISGDINGDLIDEDSDSIYDYFYNYLTESKTELGLDSEGKYLIDSTGNNKYDFVYNFETGELTEFISDESEVYTPEEFNIWIFVIVIISLLSLFISLIYIKKS